VLASAAVSGSEPAAGSGPAAGWYQDPAGSGALMWWDGRGWADPAAWRLSQGVRASLPERLTSWLASPAASPLLVTVAAITASGWFTGAAVLASVVIAGHPLTAVAAPLSASAFVLPVLDGVLGLCSLVSRPVGPSRRARPGRAERRAARRAAGLTRRRPATMLGAFRALLGSRSPAKPSSLPRRTGLVLAAASWSTVLLFAWLTVRALLHGGVAVEDAGASAVGQQLAAAAWMVHFIVWCRAACRPVVRARVGRSPGPSGRSSR